MFKNVWRTGKSLSGHSEQSKNHKFSCCTKQEVPSLHSITKEIDDRLPAVTQGHPMEGGRSALRPFLVIGDLFAPL